MEKESEKEKEPVLSWEYKTQFKVQSQMKDLIRATIKASQDEVDKLRKKLERLTYEG